MFVYYRRKVVNPCKLIKRLCDYVDIATCGITNAEDESEGFLRSINSHLHNRSYLQEVCAELNFLGHVRAAFVIAQRVRNDIGRSAPKPDYMADPPKRIQALLPSPSPKRLSQCLPENRGRLREAISKLGLDEPSRDDIVKALGEYKMFSDSELAKMEREIAI